MKGINNEQGKKVLQRMVKVIQQNKQFLSDIDGEIGDGDHGINMNKGFTRFWNSYGEEEFSISEGLEALADILINEIGGSMGPLYGVIFKEMSDVINQRTEKEITAPVYKNMLVSAVNAVIEIGGAHVGDKTLLDTLAPGKNAFETALKLNKDFPDCLSDMQKAMENGWKNTKNMIAKIGRASRLGERSKGHYDAGATSCYLLFNAMAESMKEIMH